MHINSLSIFRFHINWKVLSLDIVPLLSNKMEDFKPVLQKQKSVHALVVYKYTTNWRNPPTIYFTNIKSRHSNQQIKIWCITFTKLAISTVYRLIMLCTVCLVASVDCKPKMYNILDIGTSKSASWFIQNFRQ